MSRTILILLVVGTCLVAPWPVFAQSGLGGIVDSVSRLDRNFDAADRNRDGLLSREEAGAGHAQAPELALPVYLRDKVALTLVEQGRA